jgi:hypothetical protein
MKLKGILLSSEGAFPGLIIYKSRIKGHFEVDNKGIEEVKKRLLLVPHRVA